MRKLGRFVHTILAGCCLSVTAACGASPTAPTAEIKPPQLAVTVDHMAADSSSADFTVTPTGGYFQIGKHSIYFPKKSICDPATSTYGITEWDKPCKALNRSITIHAEVRKIDGQQWVDFTPSLRFVPSTSVSTWVWIWMYAGPKPVFATAAEEAAYVKPDLNILWTPGFGMEPLDESIADPSLKTKTSWGGSIAYRRIKHFSGYMVAAGRRVSVDEPTLDVGGM